MALRLYIYPPFNDIVIDFLYTRQMIGVACLCVYLSQDS
jgi:hypothetical protein